MLTIHPVIEVRPPAEPAWIWLPLDGARTPDEVALFVTAVTTSADEPGLDALLAASDLTGAWAGDRGPALMAALDPPRPRRPFTYVITTDGTLLPAPRRSEHVACASGTDVLAAGEITVDADGHVTEITNQSTGYCPQPSCWPAVQAALDHAAISHPGAFTSAFVFRHCRACTHLNVIKDDTYVCALCDATLDLNLC